MNESIFFFFYNLAHKSVFLDYLIVFFAVWFPYIVIIVAGLFLLFHHDVFSAHNPFRVFMQKKKEILSVFFSGILAWVLAHIFKFFFSSPRPFDVLSGVQSLISDPSSAFPSGHATFFMALAISIFILHKKAGYVFMLFALLIGIARVMAGVHFPVDILAGFALGALVAYLFKKR